MAREVGFEPTTLELTVLCSTAELLSNERGDTLGAASNVWHVRAISKEKVQTCIVYH